MSLHRRTGAGSVSWSPVCGTGASRICTMGATRTRSVMCSTVCRWTRACGRGSTKASGRPPPGSSSNRLKSTGWGGGVARNLAVYFVSLSSSPTLAVLYPRGAVWCKASARAIATVIRSCRNMERSRRSLLRFAEPMTCSPSPTCDHMKAQLVGYTERKHQVEPWVVVVVVVVMVVVVRTSV